MREKRIFFILQNGFRPEVLFLRTAGGWTLPAHVKPLPDRPGIETLDNVNACFTDRYGINVRTRYYVQYDDSEIALFVVESIDGEVSAPRDGRWAGPDGLADLTLSPESLRGILESWLANSGESTTMPWSRPGGLDDALDWAAEALKDRGVSPSRRPDQVKNSYVSCVMRYQTQAGDFYLKVVPPVFVREVEIAATLAELATANLPEVLAADAARGYMLLADMGGCDLRHVRDIAVWEQAVRAVAGVQLWPATAAPVELTPPLYDWRMPVLEAAIDDLPARAALLLKGSPYALRQDEISALESALPPLKALCSEISDFAIPHAIEHGDLRAGNLRVTGEGIVIYDWAWSAIAHPFLSAASFLYIHRRRFTGLPGAIERLRDAYLEAWTAYDSMDRLRVLFGLVERCRELYYIVTDMEWARAILEALDGRDPPRWSADGWTLDRRRFYLAKCLRRLI